MSFQHRQRVTPIAKHVPAFTTPAPPSETGAREAVPVRSEVRLRVKSNTATRGDVDGAWWPRSRDPVAEFPGLVLATSSWIGPVRRVDYHVDDWNTTSQELTVEGWRVSLVGSSTLQANTVVVAGPGQRRMILLVVPSSTPGGIARAVLRSMAAPGPSGGVEEILANNGIDTTRSVSSSTLAAPQGQG